MAGVINYQYDPSQEVWVIAECEDKSLAVRQAIVIQVRANVLVTATKLEYDVQYQDVIAGTDVAKEEDVFSSLALAVAEYELRLTP